MRKFAIELSSKAPLKHLSAQSILLHNTHSMFLYNIPSGTYTVCNDKDIDSRYQFTILLLTTN